MTAMDTKLAARFMYSNIEGVPRSPERYFELLRRTENGDATTLFAVINGALQFVGQLVGKLHQGLEHEFLDAKLRAVLDDHRKTLDGPLIVFSRALSLSSCKILLGMQQHDVPAGPLTTIGELAVHGNDFLDSPDAFWESDPILTALLFCVTAYVFLVSTEGSGDHNTSRISAAFSIVSIGLMTMTAMSLRNSGLAMTIYIAAGLISFALVSVMARRSSAALGGG
jgi:hypothetical protein